MDDYTHSRAKSPRFAGSDARAFCEAMLRHAGPLHERAECMLPAMLLFRKAEPHDTVALFLAGHGADDQPNSVFRPPDAV